MARGRTGRGESTNTIDGRLRPNFPPPPASTVAATATADSDMTPPTAQLPGRGLPLGRADGQPRPPHAPARMRVCGSNEKNAGGGPGLTSTPPPFGNARTFGCAGGMLAATPLFWFLSRDRYLSDLDGLDGGGGSLAAAAATGAPARALASTNDCAQKSIQSGEKINHRKGLGRTLDYFSTDQATSKRKKKKKKP